MHSIQTLIAMETLLKEIRGTLIYQRATDLSGDRLAPGLTRAIKHLESELQDLVHQIDQEAREMAKQK